MPIVETRPRPAFDRFEKHIEEVVRAVLPMPPPIRLALTSKGEFGVLEFVGGGVASAVPLQTRVGDLWLSVTQELVAIREQRRRYRLRTRRYAYKLHPTAGSRSEAILRWEYSSDTEDDKWCRHHMHAHANMALGNGDLGIERLHLPTGWVLIEHVLRFLFHDLEVPPRTEDWPKILRASETKFYEEFTSKRYKAAMKA
jgi:hypothetical protein